MTDLRRELEELLNRASRENDSDTPDFILANYLYASLLVFEDAVRTRETWYGRRPKSEPGPLDWDTPEVRRKAMLKARGAATGALAVGEMTLEVAMLMCAALALHGKTTPEATTAIKDDINRVLGPFRSPL